MNSEKIKKLRKSKGYTLQDVAKYVGVSITAVHQWEKGVPPKGIYLIKLCRLFDVEPSEITNNVQDLILSKNIRSKLLLDMPKVPVIDLKSVTTNSEKEINIMYTSNQHIVCPFEHSEKTFAFVVDNDYMVSPAGKSYPEGVVVFCDPVKTANVGNNIIAFVYELNRCVFAKYTDMFGVKQLSPLNQRYPVITGDFTIVGPIICSYIPEQL